MASPQPPRIFHLITRLIKGGADDELIKAVSGLEGYDFTVGFGAFYDQEQVNRLSEEGIRTKRFPLIRHYNPVTAVPAVIQLARFFRKEQFDLVHTHCTEAGIIGRFAAALAGVPSIVHTVHGVPFAEDRNDALNRFVLACERRAASSTDRIVANADVITEDYLQRDIGAREQYTTIYSGIELDAYTDASPTTDLPGSRPRIVMVGRLADGKGFDVLFDAVEMLGESIASVCIVGEGPLSDSLQAEIEDRGLSDCVFLTGYRDDIPSILAASDVFVLPSYREGTPRAITEAMAAGLPVIATDIAGIPEQVADGESGFLIPTGDPSALASKLEMLVSDPSLRRQMGSHAEQRADRFSVESMLADLDQLYEELLDDGDETAVTPRGVVNQSDPT